MLLYCKTVLQQPRTQANVSCSSVVTVTSIIYNNDSKYLCLFCALNRSVNALVYLLQYSFPPFSCFSPYVLFGISLSIETSFFKVEIWRHVSVSSMCAVAISTYISTELKTSVCLCTATWSHWH